MKVKDNILIVTSISDDRSGIEAIKREFEKKIQKCGYRYKRQDENELRQASRGG